MKQNGQTVDGDILESADMSPLGSLCSTPLAVSPSVNEDSHRKPAEKN